MLNTTKQERQKNAQKEHNLKLMLEASLIAAIRPLFLALSSQFITRYTTLQLFPSTEAFNEAMLLALREHYKIVAKRFGTRIVNELGKPGNHEDVLKEIARATDLQHEVRSQQSSRIITQTTQKDMRESLNTTLSDAAQAGEALTHKQIAARASLKFDAKSLGRLTTISITETQNPAEHAKQSEVNALDKHDAIIEGVRLKDVKKAKQWISILDNVTRDAHVEADGQVVPFDQPYVVMGQNLMYPGDQSLGATIENIINCRCSSIIMIG